MTSIIGLRQDSPAAMRMLAHLQEVGPATRHQLATACHVDEYHAANELRRMVKAGGLVHVTKWTRPHSGRGSHAPVWSIGPGRDARRPVKITAATHAARRRERLVSEYGREITLRITQGRKSGGADSVVVNGLTIYRRGVGMLAVPKSVE